MIYLILYIIGAFVVSIVTALFSDPSSEDPGAEIAFYALSFFLWPVMLVLLYIAVLMSISDKMKNPKNQTKS